MLSYINIRPSQRIAALVLAALVIVMVAVPTQAAPPAQTAPGGTVNWAATPQIITSVTRHNFPWVAVDSNDKTHVVFITGDPESSWDIRYINNVSGTFSNPGVLIDTIFKNPSTPSTILAAGPNGVIHLTYSVVTESGNDPVYYRQSTNNGATWSTRQLISSGGKSAEPTMTLDAAGNAYIAWINNQCGVYNIYYRARFVDGSLSGISKPKDDCSTFQNRPSITFASGKPHIAFTHGSGAAGDVYHARLEGGQWISQNIANTPFASQNVTIASDGGNNLFLAWDENRNNENHEIFFKASFDGGVNWTAVNELTNNIGLSTAPYIAWSPVTQRAYIVWHDQNNVQGGPNEVWLREFNPADRTTTAAFQATNNSGNSTLPKIAFGTSRADLVWQDNVTNPYQIYERSGQLIGAGGCTGSLVLAGGAEQTKSGQVAAAITATCSDGGTPDTMQISIDALPPSTTNPAQVPFSANPNITMTDGGCVHTVFVRLFKNGTGGLPFSDDIKVDDIVNASLLVANPYLSGLPPAYTPIANAAQAISPADAYEGGASNGHPGYTRVRKFFLGILDNNDCTGLTDFYIPGGDTIEPQQIPDSGFAGSPALPGFGTAGKKDFTVVISDTIGNQASAPVSLIYDPDRPTLSGGSISGDTNTKTVLRTLTFSGINVNDTLYGQNESLPAGQQFWGVWVSNIHVTATPTITPDNPGLLWQPMAVSTPATQFSLEWSLFSGLDYGTTLDKAGNYRVLVRFLDGAGNATQNMISTTLTLDSGYIMPQQFLPMISR
jgi:hypothetical protein